MVACVVTGCRVSRPSHMIAESKTRFVEGSGRRKRKSSSFTPAEPGGIAQPFGFVAAASAKSAVRGMAIWTRMRP